MSDPGSNAHIPAKTPKLRPMRYSMILLVTFLLMALGMSYLRDPVRLALDSKDPSHDLMVMIQHDAALGRAIEQADQGDVTELVKWINRADVISRQRLALLLNALIRPKEGQSYADASATAYRYRHRFRAFLNVGTGEEHIDALIDNDVAYILATATPAPSDQERTLAKSLVPRLRRVATETGDPAIFDTIGCVQFADKDFAGAKESFTTAIRLARESREAGSREIVPLYEKRLEASAGNAMIVQHATGEPLRRLPSEDEALPRIAPKGQAPKAEAAEGAKPGAPTTVGSAARSADEPAAAPTGTAGVAAEPEASSGATSTPASSAPPARDPAEATTP